MTDVFVYLFYPSGGQRQLRVDNWLTYKNFQSFTGEYPISFKFSAGYEPSQELIAFFQERTNQGVHLHE